MYCNFCVYPFGENQQHPQIYSKKVNTETPCHSSKHCVFDVSTIVPLFQLFISFHLTSINPLHYIFEIPFSSSIVRLATKPLDDEIARSSLQSRSPGFPQRLHHWRAFRRGVNPTSKVIKKQDEIGIWKGDLKSFDYSPPKIFKDGSFKKQIFGGANYNFSHAKIGCCPGEPLNIQVYGEVRGWKMFVKWHVGHIDSYTRLIWVMDVFFCWTSLVLKTLLVFV